MELATSDNDTSVHMNHDLMLSADVPVALAVRPVQRRFVMSALGVVIVQVLTFYACFMLGTVGLIDDDKAVPVLAMVSLFALVFLLWRHHRLGPLINVLTTTLLLASSAALLGIAVNHHVSASAVPAWPLSLSVVAGGVLSTWVSATLFVQRPIPIRLGLAFFMLLIAVGIALWRFDAPVTMVVIQAACVLVWSSYAVHSVDTCMQKMAADKVLDAAAHPVLALLLTLSAFGRFLLGRAGT
jgi:hypothetical protein